jgi:hypothetical protein
MNVSVLFLSGLVLTVGLTVGAVIYLKQPLHRLLIELCGNAERASFWAAFSCLALVLTPLIFALNVQPNPSSASSQPLLFQLADQLKWGLIGLVAAVLVLGTVLNRSIRKLGSPASLAGGNGAYHPARTARDSWLR